MALGANLGDPAAQLAAAARGLEAFGTVLRRSPLYLTEAVGGPEGQPPYLNAVVQLETHALHDDPRTVLKLLLDIERRLGRERRERWGPRTIDLDLLDLGGRIFIAPPIRVGDEDLPGIRLPHPRMAERAFVLAPLAEVTREPQGPQPAAGRDKTWRHPTLRLTADELLERVATEGVRRLHDEW